MAETLITKPLWTIEIRAGWQQQLDQEAVAQTALRGVLGEDPGPWNWRELEAQIAEQTDVDMARVHTGLWGLINAGEAAMTINGIEGIV